MEKVAIRLKVLPMLKIELERLEGTDYKTEDDNDIVDIMPIIMFYNQYFFYI